MTAVLLCSLYSFEFINSKFRCACGFQNLVGIGLSLLPKLGGTSPYVLLPTGAPATATVSDADDPNRFLPNLILDKTFFPFFISCMYFCYFSKGFENIHFFSKMFHV